MARFISQFYKPMTQEDDIIHDLVQDIFLKYDTNRSGYLEKREALRLVDDVLASKGQQPATIAQFNRIFAEFDLNRDGVLQRSEMVRFARKFLKLQGVISETEILDTVNDIWFKFDLDRSGYLNRRETLRFLNSFLVSKGKPCASIPEFNAFFEEIDLN